MNLFRVFRASCNKNETIVVTSYPFTHSLFGSPSHLLLRLSIPLHALQKLCELRVVGSGFLWHQIRCVVAVLFIVGEGLESPAVISELLDVVANPRKPQFNMAADYPLNLLSCDYPAVADSWRHDPEALVDLVAHYQSAFVDLSIKSSICKQVRALGACSEGGGEEKKNQNKNKNEEVEEEEGEERRRRRVG